MEKRSELYRGIGAVLLGGLLVSTVVTLVFVPALLSLMMEFRATLAERLFQSAAPARNRPRETSASLRETVEDIEKEHIRRTLEHTDWNKSQAASILQIERSTLDRKIKLYELKK